MAGADMQRRRSDGESVTLRLYIAGNAPNSVLALANIRKICAEHFAGTHEIEIVDLLTEPARGLQDGIIVTPTLLRVRPDPVLRLIGTLNDTQQVMMTLVGR